MPTFCPRATEYFEKAALDKAAKEKEEFHKLGGSLQSVRDFRDQSMESTLKRLNIDFIPHGESEPQPLLSYLSKYNAEHYDPRGGYGQPLPGKFVQNHPAANDEQQGKTIMTPDKRQEHIPALFEDRWIEPLEETQGRAKWDASLGPIGPTCPNLQRLGDKGRDGYKFICMPMEMTDERNPSQSHLRGLGSSTTITTSNEDNHHHADDDEQKRTEKCQVLSIGGNDNWKFEIAMADRGCETHTFDCTLPGDGLPRRKPDRPDIHFYPYCMHARNFTDAHGRSYLTYASMLQEAGLLTHHHPQQKPPDYLKMDIEGFEYEIFTQMIQEERTLQAHDASSFGRSIMPLQIQVELHWGTRMHGVKWMPRTLSAGELALFSGMMYMGGGYLPIHLDFNPHCTPCMEVLFFKAVCDE